MLGLRGLGFEGGLGFLEASGLGCEGLGVLGFDWWFEVFLASAGL